MEPKPKQSQRGCCGIFGGAEQARNFNDYIDIDENEPIQGNGQGSKPKKSKVQKSRKNDLRSSLGNTYGTLNKEEQYSEDSSAEEEDEEDEEDESDEEEEMRRLGRLGKHEDFQNVVGRTEDLLAREQILVDS